MAMLNIEPSPETPINSISFSPGSVCHIAEIPIKRVIALMTCASVICSGRLQHDRLSGNAITHYCTLQMRQIL